MFRYSVAILAFALVVGIELLLRPLSVMRLPFLLFGTAVVAAALLFDRLKSAARQKLPPGVVKKSFNLFQDSRSQTLGPSD